MNALRRQWLDLIRGFDTPTRVGLALALLVALVMLVLVTVSQGPLRTGAAVGFFSAVVAAQGLVLWAGRNLTTPYTQAQRLFTAGDFAAARDVLLSARAAGDDDANTLTLLGNTYRQLGDLPNSQAVLSEAVDKSPQSAFALYGLGRTLLALGHYADAASTLQAAVAAGAPPAVVVELGEAQARAGNVDAAKTTLLGAPANIEPYRALMRAYWLARWGVDAAPTPQQVAAGLPYWEHAAALFAATPYGDALRADVERMKQQG